MNNYQWLLQMDGADRKAWFDAEHVETEERALDGDTDALESKSADLIHEYYKPMVAELQAKVDELKELNEYHALQYELASEDCDELQEQVDTLRSRHCPHYDATEHTCDVHETRIAELTAERDNWKEHSRTIEYRCKKAETDCEIYRKKFGKCLDYADAIHALMDDEGMA